MTFLTPYWLFAASAILIPIAIHLWNRRQGKTVKVGSLRWLETSVSRRWSSVKLNDAGLLLLRCLLLLLLAVALAQPVLVRPPQAPGPQKAAYIGQELLLSSAARRQITPTIVSLLQRGYALYAYAPGFAPIPQEQWQQISNSAKDTAIYSSASYWALLPALAALHQQPQDSVWLLTSDQQRYFAGARPAAVPENIRWLPVASEATAVWLQTAVQASPDTLLLLVGSGTREGITYSRRHAPAAAQTIAVNNQLLQLQRHGDTLQAVLSGKSISRVRVQTEPLQVAILADEAQQSEVPYLRAAISAISSYTGLPIRITTAPDTSADWVFWLRSGEVPPQLQQQVAQRGLQLWVQPSARLTAAKASMSSATGESVAVRQLSSTSVSKAQQTLWATTGSEALLTVQPVGKGHVYRFRSGFSPGWSGLGQSAQLPELLLPLLFPQPPAGVHDVRALDEQQLKPARKPVTVAAEAPKPQRVLLLPWVVLAAFILFLIERIIAGRRAKV